MSDTIFTLTIGTPGSGKTYSRCARFIVDDWLPNHEGRHISNFPIGLVPADHSTPPAYEGETFRERLAKFAAKKHGLDEQACLSRIVQIPREVTDAWEAGTSGPWDYFANVDLQGCHIAIDEMHNFCGSNRPKALRTKWESWVAEVRHLGASIEFITQGKSSVPDLIAERCHITLELVHGSAMQDPFFGIRLEYWFELKAALTRKYSSFIVEREYGKSVEKPKTGLELKERRVFRLDPRYFALYDSYSIPQIGGRKATANKRQWERRSRLGVLAWVVRKNLLAFSTRIVFAGVVSWLLLFGGLQFLIHKFVDVVSHAVTPNLDLAQSEAAREAPFSADAAASPPPADPSFLMEGKRPVVLALTNDYVVLGTNEVLKLGMPSSENPFLVVRRIDAETGTVYWVDGRISRLGLLSEPAERNQPGASRLAEPVRSARNH